MLISPENYVEELKNESYEKLIQERDRLIKNIQHFETQPPQPAQDIITMPTEDVIYQTNLQYLGELCKLISDKYCEKNLK